MRRTLLSALTPFLLLPGTVLAQNTGDHHQAMIRSARSAAIASVADHATIMDHAGNVLHQGTNGWVCMPDMPNAPNNSPMCLDEPWLKWMNAYMNKREPEIARVGVGYMLQEDFPVSNVDPFAKTPTADNQWVENGGPHIMVIVPDQRMIEGLPTDPKNGGPWVMWKGTPYAHIMIPTVPRGL